MILVTGAKGSTQEELYKAFHLEEVQEYHLLPAYAAMHWDMLRSAMPKGCILEFAIRQVKHYYQYKTDQYSLDPQCRQMLINPDQS